LKGGTTKFVTVTLAGRGVILHISRALYSKEAGPTLLKILGPPTYALELVRPNLAQYSVSMGSATPRFTRGAPLRSRNFVFLSSYQHTLTKNDQFRVVTEYRRVAYFGGEPRDCVLDKCVARFVSDRTVSCLYRPDDLPSAQPTLKERRFPTDCGKYNFLTFQAKRRHFSHFITTNFTIV